MPKQHNNVIQPEEVSDEDASQCWDELFSLRQTCLETMGSVSPIISCLKNPEHVQKCESKENLVKEAKVLKKDLEDYRFRLEHIHSNHQHKTGGTDDFDELMECLNIGEQYQEWLASFQTVVIPTVESLSLNLLGKTEEEPASGDNQEKQQ